MSLYVTIFVMLMVFCCFVYRMRKINLGVIPVFELGFFYALIVLLYFTFPLTVYLLNGMEFLPISDQRLFVASPSPEEMSEISWYYVLHMMGFSFFYILVRGRESYSFTNILYKNTDNVRLTVTLTLYIIINISLIIINNMYYLRDVQTYGETYLAIWQLPTLVGQIYNHLGSIRVTVQILLIILLISNFRKYKYLVYGLILFEFINATITLYSRSIMMVTMFSAILAYHYFITHLKVNHIMISLIPMLLLFIILGQLRAGSDVLFSSLLSVFTYNEFEAVFGTLFDYNQKVRMGDPMNISLIQAWLGDLQNIIPKQLFPFEKIDIAHTYSMMYMPDVVTFGGGFPGGTLHEAILGLGLFDAFLKGAIIGTTFSYIYNKCIIKKKSYIKMASYIWVTVLSYSIFSRGTFILIPRFIYDFLIPVLFINAISTIIRFAIKPISSNRKKMRALTIGPENTTS